MLEFKIGKAAEANFSVDEYQIFLLIPSTCDKLSDSEYDTIQERLSERGYELIYLPKLLESIPSDLVDYYIPEQNGQICMSSEVAQNRILGDLGLSLSSPLAVMLDGEELVGIRTEEGDEDTDEFIRELFEYLGIDSYSEKCSCPSSEDILFSMQGVCSKLEDECAPVPCAPPPGSYYDIPCDAVGEEFNLEHLIAELSELNEQKLRDLGLSESALRFILGHTKPKLSRLRITRHSKIILDDYSGKEIRLDDKTKALYFLFLRHPEGIAIKDLPEHINELMDLYQSISGRDDPEAMKNTIENLADPFQNNANISLSRIKKAFCEAFSSTLAIQYYVEGERGGLRKIAIDRSLVTWETIR